MTSKENEARVLRRQPAVWVGLAFFILWADYITGPLIEFPILYVLPVGLAADCGYRSLALGMAILMPVIRLWFDALWGLPWWSLFELVNGATQIFVLSVIAILAYRQGREIETLRDLLRVCSFCHRVRIHENHWESLERYVVQHSRTRFSHGVCRDCAEMRDERGGSMMVAQASAESRATPQHGPGH